MKIPSIALLLAGVLSSHAVHAAGGGVLGDFTFGPKATIGSFPGVLGGGVEARYGDLLGASVDYQFMPTLTFSAVSVGISTLTGAVRVFPFKGSFFLGTHVGNRSVEASKTDDVSGTPVTLTADVSSLILTPHLGWRWGGTTGIFIGMEFGWQLSLSNTVKLSTDPASVSSSDPEFQELERQVNDQADKLGKSGLPYIALLQIGYLF